MSHLHLLVKKVIRQLYGFSLQVELIVTAHFIDRVLNASLSASASPDCSLKMAFILSQVDIYICLCISLTPAEFEFYSVILV